MYENSGSVYLQRDAADSLGARLVDSVAATLLDIPRNRAVIDRINAFPLLGPILDAVSAVAAVVGPIESDALVGPPLSLSVLLWL